MGISGLLPLLKEAQVHGHISTFAGKRLAVDAYVWLHKGAFGCAEDLVKGVKTTKFVDYAMHRVRLLRHFGITPFIVFDGGPLPAKKGTEVSRAKSRAEHLARARAAESQGRSKEARDCYTKCVDITPEMAYQLIKALRAENVDYIVAPYEADAQLCMLEREGIVDGIITEDSDLLVFGCKQVIFKLDSDGNCVNIHRDRLAHINGAPMHGWTNTEFRRMAMLAGCDYLPSLPGVGIKTAHKLLRRFKTVEKLLQHLRLEGTRVPDDYVASFNQAELAFLHQRVYDPTLLLLRPLTPFPPGGLQADDEKWIGIELPTEQAQGLAKGDLHPETYEPIEDHWPAFQPAQSELGGPARASNTSGPLATIAKQNVPLSKGPMDAFITRSKQALPRPVGTGVNGSGPSRLSDLVPRSASPRPERPSVRSRQGSGSGGVEGIAAAARRRGSAEEGGKQVKSKFFGGGTQPIKPVGYAPSPMKKGEEDALIWEASSPAGPKVEFDESQIGDGRAGGEGATMGRRGTRDEVNNRDEQVSRLGSPSTPTRRGTARHTGKYTQSQAFTSPSGPLLSSPPNMSLSPFRPVSPTCPDMTYRQEQAERSHVLSSPPDIGRQRSLTADPFSPSPSPRASKRMATANGDALDAAIIEETQEHDCTTMRAVGHRARTPDSTAVNASSQSLLPSSPIRPPPSRILDSQPMSLSAAVEPGWTTGSSDMLDEEEVVTPSYDVAYAARARAGDYDDAPAEDEIQGSSDEESMVKQEVEKRKERAQVVSAGWKKRFSMQGPSSAQRQSVDTTPSRPLKRRKTDPVLVPSSPITPLAAQPTNVLMPGGSGSLIRDSKAGDFSTPMPKQASRGISAFAPKTPIPLSACAPRFLTKGRLGVLPPSPAQVKQDRENVAMAMSLSTAAATTATATGSTKPRRVASAGASASPASGVGELLGQESGKGSASASKPVRTVEGREGKSVVSQFRFSGAVPNVTGRSWL